MTIDINCTGAIAGQKARKLLIPLQITFPAVSGVPVVNACRVRVTYIGGSPNPDFFGIQAINGTWNNPPGVITVVESNASFDANAPPLPTFTAFASFYDPTDPNAPSPLPNPSYSASYLIEVFDGAQIFGSTTFVLAGNAIAQQSVNVVFALDHGTSMNSSAAGTARLARLKSAFPRAVQLLRSDDMLGVTSYTDQGSPIDNPSLASEFATFQHRSDATGLSTGLLPNNTQPFKSQQLAINTAHGLSTGATVVLVTDGRNNNPQGGPTLSPPQALPTSALIIGDTPTGCPGTASQLLSNDGSYMYATTQALGDFAIEKLLTQLLVNLNQHGVISDPEGSLRPGEKLSFPVHVTEADLEVEAIVFADGADELDVTVDNLHVDETPSDHHHDHHRHHHGQHDHEHHHRHEPCGDEPEKDPIRGKGVVISRRPIIPARLNQDGAKPGPQISISRAASDGGPSSPPPAPARFNLVVIARTDLRLDADLEASGLTVGSDLLFSAALSEYGQTWDHLGVSAQVELTHPDGGVQTLVLDKVAPGRFQKSLRAFRTGAYTAHFIVTGKSLLKQSAFRRECVRTIAVFPPSDCCSPSQSSPPGK
jgi:hypothetical protein